MCIYCLLHGGGPAIVDIDQDGADEIVVATSFGVVYLIERDGSYQTLTPPSGYDFDKFLGCAVGDVDGDSQLEIVVSCQRKIEVRNQEQVSILLFNKNGAIWNVNEIASTNFNEEVASPFVAGTPVLFQANSDDYLEIALRTKANLDYGGVPHLYVWRYDAGSGDWVDFSNDFPVSLDGFFFNAPTAVDFDEDGFEELIVTSYGPAGVGTELKIIDFQIGGNVVVSTHGLPELDTGHETARAFGTLAAAEENGTFYISGVAKTGVLSGEIDKVFVYALDTDPVGVTLVWQTPWMNGRDFCSNVPGPAIGDLDGNSDLEVVYTLNGENVMRGSGSTYEGVTYGWDLGDGSMEFQSTNIPYNPVIGGGSLIRSQPVTGLTTIQGSGEMAIFSGFSSVNSRVSSPPDFSSQIIQPDISELTEPVIYCRTVEVVAFNGGRPVGSVRVPLEEGFHQVEIPLQSQRYSERSITVIADPFNEYLETDETNNSSTVTSTFVTSGISEVLIPSPSETIKLSINLTSALPEGVSVRVYSIDGRLVGSLRTEELHTGNTTLLPCEEEGRLPAGMYTVCVTGLGEEEFVRKVIILGN